MPQHGYLLGGVLGSPGCSPTPCPPQVAVVRLRGSDRVYAMKILHKWEMLKRAEVPGTPKA